jgi:hypothetical protein
MQMPQQHLVALYLLLDAVASIQAAPKLDQFPCLHHRRIGSLVGFHSASTFWWSRQTPERGTPPSTSWTLRWCDSKSAFNVHLDIVSTLVLPRQAVDNNRKEMADGVRSQGFISSSKAEQAPFYCNVWCDRKPAPYPCVCPRPVLAKSAHSCMIKRHGGCFEIKCRLHVSHNKLDPTAEQKAAVGAGSTQCKAGELATNQTECAQLVFVAAQQDADVQLGRLWTLLGDLDLHESTLLLFSTDNGPEEQRIYSNAQGSQGPFRGRKRSLYEGGTRVPSFAVWGGGTPNPTIPAGCGGRNQKHIFEKKKGHSSQDKQGRRRSNSISDDLHCPKHKTGLSITLRSQRPTGCQQCLP